MLVIRAGTYKMLVRIAGSALFVQAFWQTNHLLYSSETAITGFLEYKHIFQTFCFSPFVNLNLCVFVAKLMLIKIIQNSPFYKIN